MRPRPLVAAISRFPWPAASALVLTAGLGCGTKQPVQAPPPEPSPCAAPDCVVLRYQEALLARDFETFAGLHHPEFTYIGHDDADPPIQVDLTEWLRLHRRMLLPSNPLPGEERPPEESWLVSLEVTLALRRPFEERRDLYRDPVTNPGGLDSLRWQALGAPVGEWFFLRTQGETHYQVTGGAELAVAVDRRLPAGAPGKFLLYRFEDGGEYHAVLGAFSR